jgi:hypothetical protein
VIRDLLILNHEITGAGISRLAGKAQPQSGTLFPAVSLPGFLEEVEKQR